MKIGFVTRTPESLPGLQLVFQKHGFVESSEPEIVVVNGGDGTLLRAEREFPGVPKALVKDSAGGHLYPTHSAEQVATAILEKNYAITEHLVLEAAVHSVHYRAANDVIIRNKLLTHAIRFTLSINGTPLQEEFIGDGLVIATPLGSSAYHHSITRNTLQTGIGVAFNNVVQKQEPLVVPEASEIQVFITRGPADLGVDNSVHVESLEQGNVVTIRKSQTPMRILTLR